MSSVHFMARVGHNHLSVQGPSGRRFRRCLDGDDVADLLSSSNNQVAQCMWIEGWSNCEKNDYSYTLCSEDKLK